MCDPEERGRGYFGLLHLADMGPSFEPHSDHDYVGTD
jgi:hypothetical protein